MPEAWELSEDEPSPLPDEYWHIYLADASYDRIARSEAVRLMKELADPSIIAVEYRNLAGGKCFVLARQVIGLTGCTPEVRKVDRAHTRWLMWEAKQDPYLKSIVDND